MKKFRATIRFFKICVDWNNKFLIPNFKKLIVTEFQSYQISRADESYQKSMTILDEILSEINNVGTFSDFIQN